MLILANTAVATDEGLLDVTGLGWTIATTPTAPAALVVLIRVPWDQTDMTHRFAITLVGEDGRDVLQWASAGYQWRLEVDNRDVAAVSFTTRPRIEVPTSAHNEDFGRP